MKKFAGFTLVELMITVAVVGILAVTAYPTYQNFLLKGNRAAAQSHLMDIAQRQQQYLMDARSYAGSVGTLNMTTPTDVSNFYTIAIVTATGTPPTFTVTATPVAGSKQAADTCGAMSIDNNGAKTAAQSTGCW